MYLDLGEGDMVFGGKMETAPYLPCEQSLVLIRHGFLLEFVRQYLSFRSDAEMLPEVKFAHIQGDIRHLSFGVDRQRPIPWHDPVWYVQQLTADELAEAKRRGLL